MTVPLATNTSFTIWQGFNASSPSSVTGNPVSANGFLKQNTELGRFGEAPNGLYWTTVIDVPLGTDAQDAWDSFLNTMTPANSDTVLVQDYPIPGWCTPFLVVLIERMSRGQPTDRLRLYLDRCQPVLGPCPTAESGIVTGCCPNGFPTTVHVTITDAGSCPCIDGTYALTWDPTYTGGGFIPNGAWVGNVTLCSATFQIVFWCNPSGPNWVISFGQNGTIFISTCNNTPNTVSCSPIAIDFSLNMSFCHPSISGMSGCTGFISLTVTE
jgi:hypothetical protein